MGVMTKDCCCVCNEPLRSVVLSLHIQSAASLKSARSVERKLFLDSASGIMSELLFA